MIREVTKINLPQTSNVDVRTKHSFFKKCIQISESALMMESKFGRYIVDGKKKYTLTTSKNHVSIEDFSDKPKMGAVEVMVGNELFWINVTIWAKIFKLSEDTPCNLSKPNLNEVDTITNRQYWLYKNKIYWENDLLDSETLKLLLDDKLAKQRRKIERLQSGAKKPSRISISSEVKQFVWNRDNGACVDCGSNLNLEFDHIIPVSKGGSNTARNIQLLCETCNRIKGDDIA